METNLNLNGLKGGVYTRLTSPSRAKAPSGSEPLSMSPRQTEALLPTELEPPGAQPNPTQPEPEGIQDVAEPKQEQSRLVEEARKLAEKANSYMKLADTHLEFNVSEQTGRIVISVVESDTKEVVRQIPPDALDRFASRITQMRGLLFETTG